jgi:hypothetical protein
MFHRISSSFISERCYRMQSVGIWLSPALSRAKGRHGTATLLELANGVGRKHSNGCALQL